MDNSATGSSYYSNNLIRFIILFYWSLYWLFNAVDKVIGGAHFLWVGKDRFAQFERFFASAGWGGPVAANVALIIIAGLEIFAAVFFTGAFLHLLQKREDVARTWFNTGIGFTLSIFTIFSIGDQLFGDRAEILEHTIFWILTLITWVIFIHADKLIILQKAMLPRKQVVVFIAVLAILALVIITSIFRYEKNAFHERLDAVAAVPEGANLYKCSFPFLAGSKSFENTLDSFKRAHPDKQIKEVYTVPDELRKQKADGLVIYITTTPAP